MLILGYNFEESYHSPQKVSDTRFRHAQNFLEESQVIRGHHRIIILNVYSNDQLGY